MASKRCPLGPWWDEPDLYGRDYSRKCIETACAWWSEDAQRCGVVPVATTLEAETKQSETRESGHCADCRWWVLIHGLETRYFGQCRISAPSVIGSGCTEWVYTDGHDWCGEFERREVE